jgi:hypothetical protein
MPYEKRQGRGAQPSEQESGCGKPQYHVDHGRDIVFVEHIFDTSVQLQDTREEELAFAVLLVGENERRNTEVSPLSHYTQPSGGSMRKEAEREREREREREKQTKKRGRTTESAPTK